MTYLNKFKVGLSIVFLFIAILSCSEKTKDHEVGKDLAIKAWEMRPFVKMDEASPVLNPGDLTFTCPILGTLVKWEEKDVFNPGKLVDRSETYFLTPEKPYETDGQVNLVCFIEGMVPYNGKWFLYYGTADSKIAVAVYEGD